MKCHWVLGHISVLKLLIIFYLKPNFVTGWHALYDQCSICRSFQNVRPARFGRWLDGCEISSKSMMIISRYTLNPPTVWAPSSPSSSKFWKNSTMISKSTDNWWLFGFSLEGGVHGSRLWAPTLVDPRPAGVPALGRLRPRGAGPREWGPQWAPTYPLPDYSQSYVGRRLNSTSSRTSQKPSRSVALSWNHSGLIPEGAWKYETTVAWTRTEMNFFINDKIFFTFKDSVVSDKITYDLMKAMQSISKGCRCAKDVLGQFTSKSKDEELPSWSVCRLGKLSC